MEWVNASLPAKKTIALVAHDNRKEDLLRWAEKHQVKLSKHHLCATGTTGKLLGKALNIDIKSYLSGPLGGDQQIGSHIAEGKIHCLIFFWDPFEPMPHDPDVKALLRLAAVWNIPVACNSSSADLMLASELFDEPVERLIPNYAAYLAKR